MFKRERKLLIRLRSFPRLVENKLIFLHIMENGSNRAIPMNSMSIITIQSQRRQSGWILINSLKKSSLLIKIRINWDPYGNTLLSLKSHCCSLQGIGQLQKSISSFFKVYVFVFAKEKWSLFCWIWKEWPSASVWLFLKFEFRVLLCSRIDSHHWYYDVIQFHGENEKEQLFMKIQSIVRRKIIRFFVFITVLRSKWMVPK